MPKLRQRLAQLCLVALLILPAGCISNDPAQARADLEAREQAALQMQAAVNTADTMITQLEAKLDQVAAERDQIQADADAMRDRLDQAVAAETLNAEQLAALKAAAEQAQAQADAARGDALLTELKAELSKWTGLRDAGNSQLAVYLDSVRTQRAALDAGTGGVGSGANLQIIGDQLTAGAQYAPPPAGGYLELAGWVIGGLGTVLATRQTQQAIKRKHEAKQRQAERDRESAMLNAVISSMEAAKQAGGGNKIDFIDTSTRRILDTVQGSVPGTKQRVDLVRSKVDLPAFGRAA